MRVYPSLSVAISDLQQRGYTLDFNLAANGLVCNDEVCNVMDYEIVEFYRFEGATNPDDLSTVYALESLDGSKKGILVTAYGVASEGDNATLIRNLQFRDRN